MYYLKLSALLCMCLQVTLAVSVERNTFDEFSSKELDELEPLTNKESIVEVNWLPICQQAQVNENENEANNIAQESNIVYLPESVPEAVTSSSRTTVGSDDVCEPPNGLGLKNLLKKSKELLPKDRIKLIIENASQDAGVKRLKDLLTSDKFRDKIHEFAETKHFIMLRDFICRALNLNIKDFINYVRNLIAVEKLKEPIKPNSECKGRAGIRGLIQDLDDILPKQKLRDLYVSLLISDEYLVAAVRRMKSSEFRQLLQNLQITEEFSELKNMLIDAGVPLQSIKDLIDAALGWQGDELDAHHFEKI